MTNRTVCPSEIIPAITKLCYNINPNSKPFYIDITPDKSALPLECFSNVEAKIEQCGGKIVYGWLIWEWKFVLVEAEFHAVWMNLKGEYIDITPRPDGEKRVLFLKDDSIEYTNERVDNIRMPLQDIPLIKEYIDLNIEIQRFINRDNIKSKEIYTLQALSLRHEKMTKQLRVLKNERNKPCYCGSSKKYKKCHGK